jgi:hypothetical protein
VKLLLASDVAEADPAVTVAVVVPAFPEIVYVGVEHEAVKLIAVALGPTVTEDEAGVNVQPDLLGVTV